ncbi:DUF2357 domain-containing protein [Clostridium sp. DJ247]|uniref:DUF2357 domain-containing protein n=1 Tax=Clostridium sp. DJ247 TaxID=2726188 RepID=UPI001625FF86|nr:DUF2357 domain-containing protein [Clostridium sp. DJ247]
MNWKFILTKIQLKITLEVLPRKLDYREDCKVILNDVKKIIYEQARTTCLSLLRYLVPPAICKILRSCPQTALRLLP